MSTSSSMAPSAKPDPSTPPRISSRVPIGSLAIRSVASARLVAGASELMLKGIETDSVSTSSSMAPSAKPTPKGIPAIWCAGPWTCGVACGVAPVGVACGVPTISCISGARSSSEINASCSSWSSSPSRTGSSPNARASPSARCEYEWVFASPTASSVSPLSSSMSSMKCSASTSSSRTSCAVSSSMPIAGSSPPLETGGCSSSMG